jgi:hypothetical protein
VEWRLIRAAIAEMNAGIAAENPVKNLRDADHKDGMKHNLKLDEQKFPGNLVL